MAKMMYVQVPVQIPENGELKNEDDVEVPAGGFQLVTARNVNFWLSIEPKKQASSFWDNYCNNRHLGRDMQFKVQNTIGTTKCTAA